MSADKLFSKELEDKLLALIAETERLNDKMDAYIQATEKFYSTLVQLNSQQKQMDSDNP